MKNRFCQPATVRCQSFIHGAKLQCSHTDHPGASRATNRYSHGVKFRQGLGTYRGKERPIHACGFCQSEYIIVQLSSFTWIGQIRRHGARAWSACARITYSRVLQRNYICSAMYSSWCSRRKSCRVLEPAGWRRVNVLSRTAKKLHLQRDVFFPVLAKKILLHVRAGGTEACDGTRTDLGV